MLIGAGRRNLTLPEQAQDSVHNYYEKLVIEGLLRTSQRCQTDSNFLADTACVALNRLPPRYIRHDVDMTFFMSTQELAEMEEKVQKAINQALAYVLEREPQEAPEVEYEGVAPEEPPSDD